MAPIRSSCTLLVALLLAALACAAAPASAGIYAGDRVVGPTGALRQLGGLDLAQDGTGALVATLQDGGVDHVFVSRLVNGGWSGIERVDGGLPGPSSQPAVAAGAGGRVAVAFVNGGNVYAIARASAGASWGPLETVWGGGGASDPSIDLSVNGKGYLVFAAPGAGGHDVRGAYSKDAGPWSLLGAALDANPAADAGTGANRPRVGASADGIGVAVWGESGHVVARRLQGVRPSVVFADANDGLSVEGVGAAAADTPVVGIQDDDSFTAVAFRALFDVGGGTLRSRVVYRRLRGSRFEGPTVVDATPFASGQGSDDPQVATTGAGPGLVLGTATTSYLTDALLLRGDVAPTSVTQVDSIAQSTAPTHAVAAAATPLKMLVAWQLTLPGAAPELHGRYYDGSGFEPEVVLSRPELGPVTADAGIATGADDSGNIAVAYVQGSAIAVATVDQPPGRFALRPDADWQRTTRPLLRWTESRETWGRYYRVLVDGAEAGVTGGMKFRPATPLSQGVHSWQAIALDRQGQQYVPPAATVRVDTIAPTVLLRLHGKRRAGSALRLTLRATDAPPPPPPGVAPVQTSGVASVLVDWGDGTRVRVKRGNRHAYKRPGRYTLRITAIDVAGNRVTVRQKLRIAKPAKPRRHH